jgi:type IV secretory pathway TraG/TraD family ATPase VirD4
MSSVSRRPGPARGRPRYPDAADLARIAIVHDIKGENWQLTAGWWAGFGLVLLFDPTDPDSSAYNPLLEVRRGDTEIRDVQNVADTLANRLSRSLSGKPQQTELDLPAHYRIATAP